MVRYTARELAGRKVFKEVCCEAGWRVGRVAAGPAARLI